MTIINKDNNENIPLRKNRVLFNLKSNSLIQKLLINTLLSRHNLLIEDLALILHIDKKKLLHVKEGNGLLTERKSEQLVSLFYM